MTPEQQRIAIAEACGWRHDYDTKNLKSVWISPKSGYAYDSADGMFPSYISDLNSMHDAEMSLAMWQRARFRETLSDMLSDECGSGWAVHATAAQRAEAFLRTIGKWVE